MKKDSKELVKTCHACQVLGDAIYIYPNVLQDMTISWPFHTWGLDLIGPINPPSNGYIWILAATEHFKKWVEAIPLKKKPLEQPWQTLFENTSLQGLGSSGD